jgi:hypothetical protein
MATVYISYHGSDHDYVKELASTLSERGHQIFFPGEEIQPGKVWEIELNDSLRQSDALLAIISPEAEDSKWLLSETGAALAYYRERGHPVVIPVMIGGASLPSPLRSIQGLFADDLTISETANRIDRALASIIGAHKAQEDQRRETQRKVEANAATYIKTSLNQLKLREDSYRRVAYFWYTLAMCSLIGGLVFGIWRAATIGETNKSPTWESLAQLGLITILVVGVLGALSRFAFLLGKAFMVESLRNADRIHAISFGEFYLNAFGDKADWSEVKEVFQHWNIDKGSSFIEHEAKEVDTQILQTALDIAKSISGVKD